MNTSNKKTAALFVVVFLISALGGISGCKPKKAEEGIRLSTLARVPDIKERLAKYSPTDIVFDEALLDEENRQLLVKFVAAARHMDDIFWKQAYPEGPALRKALEKSTEPWAPDFLRFFKINFGPFDRQDENRPFLGSAPKLLGAGFYPADLTQPEFEDYVASHPEVKESFLSHQEGGGRAHSRTLQHRIPKRPGAGRPGAPRGRRHHYQPVSEKLSSPAGRRPAGQ